jgi:hypothetical protein
MKDNSTNSTRDVRFSQLNIDNIVKIEVFLKYHTYVLNSALLPATFLEFIHFRSTGRRNRRLQNGEIESVPLNTWTVGWRDVNGIEHLDEFDFKSGKHISRKDIISNSETRKSHFHPVALARHGNGV